MQDINDKSVTIEDVAREAGVSVATVSRALRDLPNVAPSTRERVRAVAVDLDYVVDPSASRFAARQTGTIAVVVHVFDTWYSAKVVAGIEAVLSEANRDLLLYAVTNEAERKEFLAGRGAWWRRSDGLIMVDVDLSALEAKRLAANGSAIVTVGMRTDEYPSVELDEDIATKAAADHLVSSGHTRIGVLHGDLHAVGGRVPRMRLEAFRRHLISAGLTIDPELERSGGFSVDGGRDGMAELLDLDAPPTAVFAMSDEMAFGALDCLRQRGLTAPDDVAVVGFDDNDLSSLFGLTTVRQDVERIGANAARLVLSSIANPGDEVEHSITPTSLVVRSTA